MHKNRMKQFLSLLERFKKSKEKRRSTKSSPGHNHFWILDDVTNMDVVVGHRGNSLITLFEP